MAKHRQQPAIRTLDELFKAEPDRLSRLSFELSGIYFDWSKTHLDAGILGSFADPPSCPIFSQYAK